MAETSPANDEKKADVQDDAVRPSDPVSEVSIETSKRSDGDGSEGSEQDKSKDEKDLKKDGDQSGSKKESASPVSSKINQESKQDGGAEEPQASKDETVSEKPCSQEEWERALRAEPLEQVQAGFDGDFQRRGIESRRSRCEAGSSARHEKSTQPVEERGGNSRRRSTLSHSEAGEDKHRRLTSKRELRADVKNLDAEYLKRALDKHETLNKFVRWTGGQKKGVHRDRSGFDKRSAW